ncbi:hypothetical protein ACYSNR_00965 [Enterococcus sp. LJL128]
MLLEKNLNDSFDYEKKRMGFSDEQNERVQYIALSTSKSYFDLLKYITGFRSAGLSIDDAIESAEKHYL